MGIGVALRSESHRFPQESGRLTGFNEHTLTNPNNLSFPADLLFYFVDFVSPSTSIDVVSYTLDSDSWNLWGIAGLDIGPIGFFAKVGYIAWDVSGSSVGESRESISDDGTDLAYGIGAKLLLGSLELRGELEMYDIEGAESLNMISAGLAWRF